jgi:hypothetical protein
MSEDVNDIQPSLGEHANQSQSGAKRRWEMPRVIVASSLLGAQANSTPPFSDASSFPFLS